MALLKKTGKEVTYVIEDVADLSICEKLLAYNLLIPKLNRRRKRYDDRLIVVKH